MTGSIILFREFQLWANVVNVFNYTMQEFSVVKHFVSRNPIVILWRFVYQNTNFASYSSRLVKFIFCVVKRHNFPRSEKYWHLIRKKIEISIFKFTATIVDIFQTIIFFDKGDLGHTYCRQVMRFIGKSISFLRNSLPLRYQGHTDAYKSCNDNEKGTNQCLVIIDEAATIRDFWALVIKPKKRPTQNISSVKTAEQTDKVRIGLLQNILFFHAPNIANQRPPVYPQKAGAA